MKQPTVAIVCSAAYLKDKNFGAEIDSFDIVVRVNLNWQQIPQHSKDIGNKTDVIYLCNGQYKAHRKLTIPKGVKLERKFLRLINRRDKSIGFSSNTGVVAALDYALRGCKVKCFGLDFYAGAYNGVIPSPIPPTKRQPTQTVKVKRNLVYLEGYNNDYSEYVVNPHFGGINDLEFLLRFRNFNIDFDPYMKQVIEQNKHRVMTNREKTDIVIPLGLGSKNNDNEIRYALRSIAKNFLD